jgi:hypothetical protein
MESLADDEAHVSDASFAGIINRAFRVGGCFLCRKTV